MPYNYHELDVIGDREIIEEQKYQIIWRRPNTNSERTFSTTLPKWEEWLLNQGHRKEGDINPSNNERYVKAICSKCGTELHYSKLIPASQQYLPLCLRCGQKKIRLEKEKKARMR